MRIWTVELTSRGLDGVGCVGYRAKHPTTTGLLFEVYQERPAISEGRLCRRRVPRKATPSCCLPVLAIDCCCTLLLLGAPRKIRTMLAPLRTPNRPF